MEPNSSNKIVSLHMERCSRQCENRSCCYHVNKDIIFDNDLEISSGQWLWFLRKGYLVYESLCNGIPAWSWHLLKFYKNYNITISADQYEPYLHRVKDQVQITIYNEEDAKQFKEYQKLFLIKDDTSWDFFLKYCNTDVSEKLHYIFDHSYISKDQLRIAAENKMYWKISSTMTIDSCFTSFLLNGRCPYSYGNYIDITYDGTVRRCPYSKTGEKIDRKMFSHDYSAWEDEMKKLFRIEKNVKCKLYLELFGGKLDVGKQSTSL